MKGINPIWLTVLAALIAFETNIATGNINLHNVLPEAWIPWAIGWSGMLASLGTILNAILPQFSSAKSGAFINDQPVISPVTKLVAMFAVILTGLLMFASQAHAADVVSAPTVAKASPLASLATGYPYQTQGIYFGLYTQGGGGSVEGSAVGVNKNSLTTNEIGVGGTVGYAWGVPSRNVFIAVEAMFGWRNFNGSEPGLSLDGPASFEQRVKIGTPLSNFLSMLPGFNLPSAPPFPAMPNGQTVTNAQAYLMVGLHEDDNSLAFNLKANRQWTIAPSIGVGMLGQLPNGVAVDAWVETVFPDKSICVGPFQCVNQGQKVLAGLAFYY